MTRSWQQIMTPLQLIEEMNAKAVNNCFAILEQSHDKGTEKGES